VDSDTRRQKQQALITDLLERKIRLHAQQLYDKRGRTEGFALQDWVQAESQVLENNILAPLYRKTRGESSISNETENATNAQFAGAEPATSGAGVS
jgi:hypothetical protein